MSQQSVTDEPLFTINHILSVRPQKLSNMTILSPSVIWIRAGYKKLLNHQRSQALDEQSLLLVRSHERLTFENQPGQSAFRSCQICFHHYPDAGLLAYSQTQSTGERAIFKLTPDLRQALEVLSVLDYRLMTHAVQRHWLDGFYQLLAERGMLHHLFGPTGKSLREKLSDYFTPAPGKSYKLDYVCTELGMSRSTLIRRLHQENTSFREVLHDVRMNHAIDLIQQGQHHAPEVALACGYQSPQRFRQRFKAQFDVSFRQYVKTLSVTP
ncbi:HTH-type transcriptional regulator YdeO [Vibrio aerogenes CECT 7868]|uniref:HTH-type transcriptional regulator YdeO n=1 Tax=Vibrio aerogenes CECT 7868 TaxID=1216006 RepID=A0A1M5ZR40_9VIBR|nr:helix-turn-helix domain-containing protein [Vibrio aerogenes]SHI26579.1 HTH-type transcriptional regulator YdeO [Vibrio aerogenes CECT 7868]